MKTCVGISGANTVIMINGKTYGDIQGIKYSSNKIELEVANFIPIDVKEPVAWEMEEILESLHNATVEIVSVVGEMNLFDIADSKEIKLKEIDSVMSYKRFNNVNFMQQKGGINADQIYQYTTFLFSYESYTPTKHLLCKNDLESALKQLR